MLITAIQVKNYAHLHQQIDLIHKQTDGVELRLDFCEKLDFLALTQLRKQYSLPMIFTLRKKSQGGHYQQEENQRLETILSLCELQPDYIDLEHDVPKDFIQHLHTRYPSIKLICSYHNFDSTPEDLPAILQSMQHPAFFSYKIATQANSTLDALRMLIFITSAVKHHILTGICMGDDGGCTRILGSIVGNTFTYVCADQHQATAAGQLSLHELLSTYRFRSLNPKTKIFALLGDPIDMSVGHILHNQAMRILNQNAVYVKLRITADDLHAAIALCRSLSFAGFSITMPLKERIVPLLDKIAADSQKINAINSIRVQNQEWLGFNTDGKGAINAITEKINLTQKNVVLLGGGGAARAIIHTAQQQGAQVIVFNRDKEKSQHLMKEFACPVYSFDEIEKIKELSSPIIINTLPATAYIDNHLAVFSSDNFFAHAFAAMDIVYQPVVTHFLRLAKQANCICIPGYEMYMQQALMQIQHWFEPKMQEMLHIKNEMRAYFNSQP